MGIVKLLHITDVATHKCEVVTHKRYTILRYFFAYLLAQPPVISHARYLHVPHISSMSGISSRSKTLFVKTVHTLLHINMKLLHMSVKLLHIKITIYHYKIYLWIFLSATVRDITYTLSTCTTHFEHIGHFVTE